MPYICIEGNIGSGKTSLARKLAKHLKAEFIAEEFEANPFLPLFYNESKKFAFALEFSFLLDRARQLSSFKKISSNKIYISDYYIQKCLSFAKINLTKKQFEQFEKAFPAVASLAPLPDLIVYLHISEENLIRNILKRGRKSELKINRSYLKKINIAYKKTSIKKSNFSVLNFFISEPTEKNYQIVFENCMKVIQKLNNKITKKTIHI